MSDPTAPDPMLLTVLDWLLNDEHKPLAQGLADTTSGRAFGDKDHYYSTAEWDKARERAERVVDSIRARFNDFDYPIPALSDSTPSAPTLDVERLAHAYNNIVVDFGYQGGVSMSLWKDVAAEYARLRETPLSDVTR